MKKLAVIAAALIALPSALSALTAEEIIRRVEDNTVFETSRSTGAMIVTDRFGTKESTFIALARGTDTSLLEFTSVEERGMKILRTRDDIYLFYPDAEELIRLQGAALRDSVMGSDISYEDLTGGKELLEKYAVALLGTEPIDGNSCYKIELIARSRSVAYYRQIVWVDAALFVNRRVHMFARSGKLLKEMDVEEIATVAGHVIPVRSVLRDKLKKESSTVFQTTDIQVDVPLAADTFSLDRLTW